MTIGDGIAWASFIIVMAILIILFIGSPDLHDLLRTYIVNSIKG